MKFQSQQNWNKVFRNKEWGEYPAEDLVRFIKNEKKIKNFTIDDFVK